MGGALEQPHSGAPAGLERHRIAALFLLTAFFVVVKTIAHDIWSVAFGLAMLGVILLTPDPAEHSPPWRGHALRVVSACFVVVTLASIWTTLSAR
jgi:apolipoprotein N-acyltransferase